MWVSGVPDFHQQNSPLGARFSSLSSSSGASHNDQQNSSVSQSTGFQQPQLQRSNSEPSLRLLLQGAPLSIPRALLNQPPPNYSESTALAMVPFKPTEVSIPLFFCILALADLICCQFEWLDTQRRDAKLCCNWRTRTRLSSFKSQVMSESSAARVASIDWHCLKCIQGGMLF